jgi:hypothetical protein
MLAWGMVLAPLAAVVVLGVMIAGERGRDGVARDVAPGAGPQSRVAIVDGASFDPPPGDGAEREDIASLAWDGDITTSWQTEGYDSTTFIPPKEGVGLRVELAEARLVRDVAILTDLQGWKVQVLVSGDAVAPAQLSGWTQGSEPVAVRSGERIPVSLGDDPFNVQHVLLWITAVSIDTKDLNRSRARIAELRVFADTTPLPAEQ